MEEEIDLRPYINVLTKYWYVIIGVGVLTAVITFLILSLQPPRYEATSLVVAVNPQEVVEFDSRFRQIVSNQPLRGYPELALSDEVLQAVLTQQTVTNVTSTEDLRQMFTAETGDDLSIIRLQAVASQPEEAALLANTWASIFTARVNDIFSNRSGEQLSYFETQLQEAQSQLASAEEALVAYQMINRSQIISNTLTVHMTMQARLLSRQQQIRLLQQNVQHLRDQLTKGGEVSSTTLADQLTALSLQLAVFETATAAPLLQIDTSVLTGENRTEQIAVLDNLLLTLTMQDSQVSAELAALEPLILGLQKEGQEAAIKMNQIRREQLVAEETLLALARKVAEERITSQDTSTGVKLASEAIAPVKPMSSGRLLFTAVAGLLGMVLIFFGLLCYTWLKVSHTIS